MSDAKLREAYLSAKRALFDQYYESLNERQRESVYQVNGPLLVLAGAGSGKTTVLVTRLAHIIRYGDKIAGEDESISTYYPNNHLNRMRHGR